MRYLLRAATASLHRRVDTHMTALLKQSDGYARFLLATARAQLPLERALEAANVFAILPDWAQRSRSASLRSDLAAMSLVEPVGEVRLPRSDEAYLLGIVYVLEGSRLGARVVLRQLEMSTSTDLKGVSSYLSHGQSERLWQTFLTRLEASEPVKRNREAAVAGASDAFEMFLRQIDLANQPTDACLAS
jgi:heme oxygenase